MGRSIHPEKKQAVMDEIAKCFGKPTEKILRGIAARHGVSIASVYRWSRHAAAKANGKPPPVPAPAVVVSPPPAYAENQDPTTRVSPKSILLRHFAAQALFLAEQLELLAGDYNEIRLRNP